MICIIKRDTHEQHVTHTRCTCTCSRPYPVFESGIGAERQQLRHRALPPTPNCNMQRPLHVEGTGLLCRLHQQNCRCLWWERLEFRQIKGGLPVLHVYVCMHECVQESLRGILTHTSVCMQTCVFVMCMIYITYHIYIIMCESTKGSARDEWGRFSCVVGFIYLLELSLIKL